MHKKILNILQIILLGGTYEVTLKVVMSATDKVAYDFMQEFRPSGEAQLDLENQNTMFHTNNVYRKFNFEPIFFFQQIVDDQESVNKHCIDKNIGNLCLPTVNNPGEVMESQIYQACVYKQSGAKQYLE